MEIKWLRCSKGAGEEQQEDARFGIKLWEWFLVIWKITSFQFKHLNKTLNLFP